MISRPPGWTLVPSADHYMLIAPEGPMAAGVRYVERVHPLRRLGDIVDDWLRHHQKVADPKIGAPERLITVEGEHAAVVTIAATFDGAPAECTLGVVFGDDFYSRIEGFAIRPDQFERIRATVRELTLHDAHVLGHRRRRYAYAPPAGWQALVRGFVTDWLAPGFPHANGVVTVHPATPSAPGAEPDVGDLVTRAAERGFAVEAAPPAVQIETPHGLTGVVAEMIGRQAGARALRALAILHDAHYLYVLELAARTEDAWPEHRDAFAAFWRSVEPLPDRQAPASSLFDIWAE